MTYQAIGLGTTVGDGTGDTIRDGGDKVNDNFVEIYSLLGTGTELTSGISATATVVTLAGPSITGVASFADGSNTAPSITNTGDTNTGIYFGAADTVNITTGGTKRIEIDSSGLDVTGDVTATTFVGALTGNVTTTGIILGGTTVTASAAELNYNDITTLGTVEASKTVTADASGDVLFVDNDKLKFGTTVDGNIYSDGTNFTFSSTTAETHYANYFQWSNGGASETLMTATENGSVDLYYDNAKKFETTAAGVTITGTMTTSGNIIIPNAGNIGSVGDTDAIAIASNGVVTFSQIPVMPADSISSAELKSLSTLLIKDSGGTTLATFHTAGA
jgi:hypothetical protein